MSMGCSLTVEGSNSEAKMKPSIKGKFMVGWRVYEDYEVYGSELAAYGAYGVEKVRRLHFRYSRNDLRDQVSGANFSRPDYP